MLINLSNHPLRFWGELQVQETRNHFGRIEDMQFPLIDPGISHAELKELVENYASTCIKLFETASEEENAVHIMGEMVFTCALVSKLLKRNIRCIASASSRKVENSGNRKTSYFEFTGFRDYFLF